MRSDNVMGNSTETFNYKKFCAKRKRMEYNNSHFGAQKPRDLMKQPTRRQMLKAAKRFVADGEISNAVHMLRLAYPESRLQMK